MLFNLQLHQADKNVLDDNSSRHSNTFFLSRENILFTWTFRRWWDDISESRWEQNQNNRKRYPSKILRGVMLIDGNLAPKPHSRWIANGHTPVDQVDGAGH